MNVELLSLFILNRLQIIAPAAIRLGPFRLLFSVSTAFT